MISGLERLFIVFVIVSAFQYLSSFYAISVRFGSFNVVDLARKTHLINDSLTNYPVRFFLSIELDVLIEKDRK